MNNPYEWICPICGIQYMSNECIHGVSDYSKLIDALRGQLEEAQKSSDDEHKWVTHWCSRATKAERQLDCARKGILEAIGYGNRLDIYKVLNNVLAKITKIVEKK